jgi:hypothetical protein
MSAAAYLLLGAALLAYVGLVSWLQGALGATDWLAPMVRQLLATFAFVVGQPLSGDPVALISALLQAAPWLALLPLALLLWERDRALSRPT